MAARLGLKSRSLDEDVALANAAFQAIGEGGEDLRWEPFSSTGSAAWRRKAAPWPACAPIAMAGRRRRNSATGLGAYEPRRPELLDHPYFTGPEPQELLYDEIEAIWAAIAERDDWSPLPRQDRRHRRRAGGLWVGDRPGLEERDGPDLDDSGAARRREAGGVVDGGVAGQLHAAPVGVAELERQNLVCRMAGT